MPRSALALLTSIVLASAGWGQAPPVVDSSDPAPAVVEDGDCRGCCNLAHPWRSAQTVNATPIASSACDSCNPTGVCGPAGRIWFELDYLYWSTTGDLLPALVTTGPEGNPPVTTGVLPGATVLFGNEYFNSQNRSGVRMTMGGWLNQTQTLGLQMSGFFLEDAVQNASFESDGAPTLARPFNRLDAPAGAASQLIAFPDFVDGGIAFRERSTLHGIDFAVRGNVCCGEIWRVDALVGYRYLRMTDQLSIDQRLEAGPLNPTVTPGTIIETREQFDTANVFHGGQVGFAGDIRFGKLRLDGTAKVSFGGVSQGVGINGVTRFTPPGNDLLLGGLLALNSNIGAYRRSDASLVPELMLNASYQVTNSMRIRLGYDLIYLPNVQRPGGTIDLGIDTARIPPVTTPTVNPARPSFDNNSTDFLIQGIHAGIEFRF